MSLGRGVPSTNERTSLVSQEPSFHSSRARPRRLTVLSLTWEAVSVCWESLASERSQGCSKDGDVANSVTSNTYHTCGLLSQE